MSGDSTGADEPDDQTSEVAGAGTEPDLSVSSACSGAGGIQGVAPPARARPTPPPQAR